MAMKKKKKKKKAAKKSVIGLMPISHEIASPSRFARRPSGVSPERLDESPAALLLGAAR